MTARYHPFSQDFNSDAEGWELTDTFGDRSLRIWHEVLSILDREKNHWKLVEGWDSVIARKVRQSPATVQRVVGWMLAKGWLAVGQLSASGQPEVLRAPKFAKYHKTNAEQSLSPNLTSPPNPPKNHKNDSSTEVDLKTSTPWPDEYAWLLEFVNALNGTFPKDKFADFGWWDAVSYTCGGLSKPFLEAEFGKMRRWLMDNPKREPTPKGYRKFVAGWLERAHDKERRFKNEVKSR